MNFDEADKIDGILASAGSGIQITPQYWPSEWIAMLYCTPTQGAGRFRITIFGPGEDGPIVWDTEEVHSPEEAMLAANMIIRRRSSCLGEIRLDGKVSDQVMLVCKAAKAFPEAYEAILRRLNESDDFA